ncbi:MAG: hypothetical protein WCK00_12405 [Deltaproteobacteria bacterium]
MNKKTRREFLGTLGTGAAVLGLGSASNLFAGETGASTMEKKVASEGPYGFKYFVGIVGNPSKPDIEWSDEQMKILKDLGVNMLQLSIAWGGQPANEVIGLEDLDADQRVKWTHRVKQANKFGFETLAQFGIPRIMSSAPGWASVRPACILDPAVREKYRVLLADFLTTFPSVKNIMVYTYDQRAWVCSEFGPCPRCSGIPVEKRLPGFIDHLMDTMQKHSPGSGLWWKPWELTKGQTLKVVQSVKPAHFGLILNPSTSNEVYPFNDRSFKSDLGVKRLVAEAKDLDIPVIGEFDHTLYKGLYGMSDYCPRFVHDNLIGWKELDGVVGIKEYYGFAPSLFSVNAAMLKAAMKSPEKSLPELLKEIAAPYGEKAAPIMIQAWDYVARGIEAFPWDVTYLIGPMGLNKTDDGSHGWEPVTIPNGSWDTPIWESNRRGNFMLTKEYKAHPWLFEDAGLRLEDCAALQLEAVKLFDKAIALGGNKVSDIKEQRDFVWHTARAVRGKGLHFVETIYSQSARILSYDPKQYGIVLKQLDELLVKDLENQGGAEPMAKKLADFRKDPTAWLNSNLSPLTYESICNIDWSKWISFPGEVGSAGH